MSILPFHFFLFIILLLFMFFAVDKEVRRVRSHTYTNAMYYRHTAKQIRQISISFTSLIFRPMKR